MTLNEIGALCMGYEYWEACSSGTYPEGWHHPTDCKRGCDGKPPDITLSDPPTDAQIANVWRLREKAIETNRTVLSLVMIRLATEDNIVLLPDGCSFAHFALRQMRDASLETLCPPEHTEQLARLLEGE